MNPTDARMMSRIRIGSTTSDEVFAAALDAVKPTAPDVKTVAVTVKVYGYIPHTRQVDETLVGPLLAHLATDPYVVYVAAGNPAANR